MLEKRIWERLIKGRFRYPIIISGCLIAVIILFLIWAVPSVADQSKVNNLLEITPAVAGQKVMVFSPHPDDETIAVGGYIAQSVKNGADVRIVLVTNGNKDHDMTVRYTEFKTATGILGVPDANLIFLGFPDGRLSSENQTILEQALITQIDNYQPEIVIYPHTRDYNLDHAILGRVLEKIIKNQPEITVRYEYLVHYKLIYPRPYGWEFNSKLSLLPPNSLMKNNREWLKYPLSAQIETLKEKALLSYKSQFHSLELNGLLHSSIRKNELMAVPSS
jgi:N-acetylglucosamine malate deacetylase 1